MLGAYFCLGDVWSTVDEGTLAAGKYFISEFVLSEAGIRLRILSLISQKLKGQAPPLPLEACLGGLGSLSLIFLAVSLNSI